MTDDKKKAERHFNWQAIKEAVERMKPELIAASEAAHKAKDADAEGDQYYSDFASTRSHIRDLVSATDHKRAL
jgi:hypothetical protein